MKTSLFKMFPKTAMRAAFCMSLLMTASLATATERSDDSDNSVKAKAERIADKTGAAVNKGAVKTKHGLAVAAEHTEHALHTAADKTQKALQKTSGKIKKVMVGDEKEK